jgi:hypothetical protein
MAVRTEDASAGAAAERTRARIAAVTLIASPILWLVGALAFFNTLGAFYNPGDGVTKLNAIAGQRVAWTTQSLIFFAGALSASSGLIFLARLLRSDAPALARGGTIAAAAAAAVGAFFFIIRLAAPLDGVRDASEVPTLLMATHRFGTSAPWLGVLNILVPIAAVGLLAIAMFTSGRAKLTGALVTLLCGVVGVVLLAGGPLPPVTVYPICAILGVRLLFWRATRA